MARYCADWKPDDVPSVGRNASYSDGVSVSSTAHCSKSCLWIALTRARILKQASSRSWRTNAIAGLQLVDHQLHPQLGGLVLDDEQHLVVPWRRARTARERVLRRQQPVEPQVARIGEAVR